MATALPTPSETIQRVLFLAPTVHVYQIPPLSSLKGHTASSWTAQNNSREIFTARLRILESAPVDADGNSELYASSSTSSGASSIKTDILLEDPKSGELFAAAPYTSTGVVEQVLDSSRFFAVRVEGEGGRKATLGIGFEERSEAFDFGVALQEVKRVLGLDGVGASAAAGQQPGSLGGRKGKAVGKQAEPPKKDWSLKEGESIKVDIGMRGRRKEGEEQGNGGALYSIKPPPSHDAGVGGGTGDVTSFLSPPPSAKSTREEKRRSLNLSPQPRQPSAAELGFDDGEFGEFQ